MSDQEPDIEAEELREAVNVTLDALQLSLRALSAIQAHENAWPGAEYVLSAPEYDRLARYVDEFRFQVSQSG